MSQQLKETDEKWHLRTTARLAIPPAGSNHCFRRPLHVLLSATISLLAGLVLCVCAVHAQTTPPEKAGQGTRLEVVGRLETDENVRMPAAHMPYLYAADQKRFVIYDLTQLSSPVRAASLDLTTFISGTSDIFYVDVHENLAFVAAGKNEVFVIDVSTPTTPTLVLQRQLPSWHDIWAVLADGEILYVFDKGPSDNWLGYHAILKTVDIADASEWRELDALDIQGGGGRGGIVLRNNKVYLLTWIMGPSPYGGFSGFTGIDVSQPASITQTVFLPLNTELSMVVGANGIAYLGDSEYQCRSRIYLGACSRFLETVRVEGSGAPTITAQHNYLPQTEGQYETLGMIDEYLLASVDLTDQHIFPQDPYTRSMALRLFDTLDPDHPALVDSYEFVRDWNPYRGHFLVDGDFIFVIGKSDVVILRLIRQTASALIAPDGGKLVSQPDGITYLFPAGALTSAMTVTHTTRALRGDEAITGTLFSTGLAFQLELTDTDGHTVSQTEGPFSVTIDYSANGLGSVFALSPALYRHEEGRWEPQPSVVDPVNQTLTATLRREGLYSILGKHRQQRFFPFVQSPP